MHIFLYTLFIDCIYLSATAPSYNKLICASFVFSLNTTLDKRHSLFFVQIVMNYIPSCE